MAGATKVALTFSGTAEFPAVPLLFLFAPDDTQSDILQAYFRHLGHPVCCGWYDIACFARAHRPLLRRARSQVPAGAKLCVRPSPTSPDAARLC